MFALGSGNASVGLMVVWHLCSPPDRGNYFVRIVAINILNFKNYFKFCAFNVGHRMTSIVSCGQNKFQGFQCPDIRDKLWDVILRESLWLPVWQ